MPLHIGDYLADTGHLNVAEHGAYMLLIMHYWQNGRLPESERLIARVARMTPEQWDESRDVLAMLFGPKWTHKRIDEELAKAEAIIEKRRTAGRARQSSKPAAEGEQVVSTCSAHADTRAGTPSTNNQDSYAADARADDVTARIGELYAALGVTDETKSPGLLAYSEPIRWVAAGCDVDADILPALRSIAARGKTPKSWSYCSEAVFEARDRRLAPAPKPTARNATAPPAKPRNVGELSRQQLDAMRNGNAPSPSDRHQDQGDGNAGFAGTGIARRIAVASGG